jgi:hypothetical protein
MNHINEASYMGLTHEMKLAGNAVIDVAKLNELAADHVDKAGVPFDAFIADENQSAVMRGYVKSWLGRVFKQFDGAKLSEL